MTKRNPWTCWLLSFVTFGIYGIYWLYTTFEEARKHTGDTSIPTGIMAIIFCIIPIVNLWFLFIVFRKMLNKVEEKGNQPQTTLVTFLIRTLIPIVNWFFIVFVQTRINKSLP